MCDGSNQHGIQFKIGEDCAEFGEDEEAVGSVHHIHSMGEVVILIFFQIPNRQFFQKFAKMGCGIWNSFTE